MGRFQELKHDDSNLDRYPLCRSGPDGLRGQRRFSPGPEPNVWFRRVRSGERTRYAGGVR
jgi:hypothetical protein